MGKFIDFKNNDIERLGSHIHEGCQEALENYFIRGYQPGGFLTAMLSGELYRAVGSADMVNRKVMWQVAKWIMLYAPGGSWGSKQAVQDWLDDVDGIRTKFSTQITKEFVWRELSTVQQAANS